MLTVSSSKKRKSPPPCFFFFFFSFSFVAVGAGSTRFCWAPTHPELDLRVRTEANRVRPPLTNWILLLIWVTYFLFSVRGPSVTRMEPSARMERGRPRVARSDDYPEKLY